MIEKFFYSIYLDFKIKYFEVMEKGNNIKDIIIFNDLKKDFFILNLHLNTKTDKEKYKNEIISKILKNIYLFLNNENININTINDELFEELNKLELKG